MILHWTLWLCLVCPVWMQLEKQTKCQIHNESNNVEHKNEIRYRKRAGIRLVLLLWHGIGLEPLTHRVTSEACALFDTFPCHTIAKVWRRRHYQQILTHHVSVKAEHCTVLTWAKLILCDYDLTAVDTCYSCNIKCWNKFWLLTVPFLRWWKKKELLLWERKKTFFFVFVRSGFSLCDVLLVVQVFWPWGPQNPFSILNKISKIHSHQS